MYNKKQRRNGSDDSTDRKQEIGGPVKQTIVNDGPERTRDITAAAPDELLSSYIEPRCTSFIDVALSRTLRLISIVVRRAAHHTHHLCPVSL